MVSEVEKFGFPDFSTPNSSTFQLKKGKKATVPPYLFPNKVTFGKDYFPSKKIKYFSASWPSGALGYSSFNSW